MNTAHEINDFYQPSHKQIRRQRLVMALEKIENMKPCKIRDTLIQDFEQLIGAIHLADSKEGQGSREGSGGGRAGL